MTRFNPGIEIGFAEQVQGIDENGNPVVAINWPLTEDELEQVRQGYRCVQCVEPFEEPFPELCPICNFKVRDYQLQALEFGFQGEKHYGPTPLDRFEEEREREGWTKTKTGIVVPR